MQWQNLLPLLVDSLDYGKSYIVGDGKQSIYRWRGGEAAQFLKLPLIYKSQNLVLKSEWEAKGYKPEEMAQDVKVIMPPLDLFSKTK